MLNSINSGKIRNKYLKQSAFGIFEFNSERNLLFIGIMTKESDLNGISFSRFAVFTEIHMVRALKYLEHRCIRNHRPLTTEFRFQISAAFAFHSFSSSFFLHCIPFGTFSS